MQSSQDLITGFFRERFGRLLAEEIVQHHLKRLGIRNLKSLSAPEQMKVGQRIIQDVSGQFYTPDRVLNLKTLYLLRFSLNQAAARIEKMIGRQCEVHLKRPAAMAAGHAKSPLQTIEDKSSAKFVFMMTNTMEGALFVSMPPKEAVQLARILMQAMLGQATQDDLLDDSKLSAISEFFNILIPAFSEIVGNAFDEAIFFTPASYAAFREGYLFNNQFIWPPVVITSGFWILLEQTKCSGEILFLVREAGGNFKKLIDQANIRKSPLEQGPPTIVIRKTDSTMSDVQVLFRMLNLPADYVHELLKRMHRNDFRNFTRLDLDHFYHMLLDRLSATVSENAKENIKANLEEVIELSVG